MDRYERRALRRGYADLGDPEGVGGYGDPGGPDLRRRAIARINARRDLAISAVWFVVVNATLVLIWSHDGGFFWPVFSIVFWGMGLAGQAVHLTRAGLSEDRIQAEMRRLGGV